MTNSPLEYMDSNEYNEKASRSFFSRRDTRSTSHRIKDWQEQDENRTTKLGFIHLTSEGLALMNLA